MEESKFEILYKDMGKAIGSFRNAMSVNLLLHDDIIKDVLINGQIQKFVTTGASEVKFEQRRTDRHGDEK